MPVGQLRFRLARSPRTLSSSTGTGCNALSRDKVLMSSEESEPAVCERCRRQPVEHVCNSPCLAAESSGFQRERVARRKKRRRSSRQAEVACIPEVGKRSPALAGTRSPPLPEFTSDPSTFTICRYTLRSNGICHAHAKLVAAHAQSRHSGPPQAAAMTTRSQRTCERSFIVTTALSLRSAYRVKWQRNIGPKD